MALALSCRQILVGENILFLQIFSVWKFIQFNINKPIIIGCSVLRHIFDILLSAVWTDNSALCFWLAHHFPQVDADSNFTCWHRLYYIRKPHLCKTGDRTEQRNISWPRCMANRLYELIQDKYFMCYMIHTWGHGFIQCNEATFETTGLRVHMSISHVWCPKFDLEKGYMANEANAIFWYLFGRYVRMTQIKILHSLSYNISLCVYKVLIFVCLSLHH